jgi:branched-chain amino acid transport system substrate-binding protein
MRARIARPLSLVAAAACTGTLMLSACGSPAHSTDTSSSATQGANTGSSKLTKSTITIGMADDVTGPNGPELAASTNVAMGWEKWVNTAEGGINGHPVNVIIGDTRGDSATAASVADQMIKDHIVAEVGGADYVADSVFVQAFTAAKIPVIGGYISSAPTPYLFQLEPSTPNLIKLNAEAAKLSGAKSFAVVACAEITSCSATTAWQTAAAAAGIPWAGLVTVRAADPSYTAPCLALQQAKAGYVFLAVTAAVGVRLMSDCLQQGYSPIFGTATGEVDGTQLTPVSKAGAHIVGVLQAFPWWTSSPAVAQYRNVMENFSPTRSVTADPVQSGTWAALEMFRQVMSNAPDQVTAADVARSMWSVSNEDLGGLLPAAVTFPPGEASPDMSCAFLSALVEGNFTGGGRFCLS